LIFRSAIVKRVKEQFALNLYGIHGLPHWSRVLNHGLMLGKAEGGDLEVITLFALLHDAKRVIDGFDPEHGDRAADLAVVFRSDLFHVSDKQMDLLTTALKLHSDGLTNSDITVMCCWDADRLDLGRCGTVPSPEYLCTATAKQPAIINQAVFWATFGRKRW
jgi:uncharacterized protein